MILYFSSGRNISDSPFICFFLVIETVKSSSMRWFKAHASLAKLLFLLNEMMLVIIYILNASKKLFTGFSLEENVIRSFL